MKTIQSKNTQLKQSKKNKTCCEILQNNYYRLKKQIAAKENVTKGDICDLFKLMNIIAMTYAQNLQLQLAFQWISRCKKHIGQDLHMKIIYLNNLSCIYHRNQNYELALSELKKANQIIESIQIQGEVSPKTKIQTYLNFSALFSSMNNHIKSLSNIKNALQLLQQRYYQNEQYQQLWIAAKHNQAVQYEHLKLFQDAVSTYTLLNNFLRGLKDRNKHQAMIKSTELTIKKLKDKIKYQNLKFGFNNRQTILKRLKQKKNCQFFFNIEQIQNAFKQTSIPSTFRTMSRVSTVQSHYQKSAKQQKLSNKLLKIKLMQVQNDQIFENIQKHNKITIKAKNIILNKKRTSSLLPKENNGFQSVYQCNNYSSVKGNKHYASVTQKKRNNNLNWQKQNQPLRISIKAKNNNVINLRSTTNRILGTIN